MRYQAWRNICYWHLVLSMKESTILPGHSIRKYHAVKKVLNPPESEGNPAWGPGIHPSKRQETRACGRERGSVSQRGKKIERARSKMYEKKQKTLTPEIFTETSQGRHGTAWPSGYLKRTQWFVSTKTQLRPSWSTVCLLCFVFYRLPEITLVFFALFFFLTSPPLPLLSFLFSFFLLFSFFPSPPYTFPPYSPLPIDKIALFTYLISPFISHHDYNGHPFVGFARLVL